MDLDVLLVLYLIWHEIIIVCVQEMLISSSHSIGCYNRLSIWFMLLVTILVSKHKSGIYLSVSSLSRIRAILFSVCLNTLGYLWCTIYRVFELAIQSGLIDNLWAVEHKMLGRSTRTIQVVLFIIIQICKKIRVKYYTSLSNDLTSW